MTCPYCKNCDYYRDIYISPIYYPVGDTIIPKEHDYCSGGRCVDDDFNYKRVQINKRYRNKRKRYRKNYKRIFKQTKCEYN